MNTLFLILALVLIPQECNENLLHEYSHLEARYNPCEVPTDLENIRLHITNYQPYELNQDEDGNLVYNFYKESNYQCLAPCNVTANGTEIVDPLVQHIAACPLQWVNNRVKVVLNGVIWNCEDTFGLVSRQNGLVWHEGHQEWFLYLDLLTHYPTYYQTSDYQLMVNGEVINE